MKTLRDRAILNAALQFRARDAAVESGIQFRARRGISNEPHFRIRFAAELGSFVRGRMDLEREFFARIENFNEQWKSIFAGWLCVAEQFDAMIFHEPAQIFSGKRAVGNDAGVAGPVADFPRFADGRAGRQFFPVEPFDFTSAPNAFLENRMKSERIKHCDYAVVATEATPFVTGSFFSKKWPCARYFS